MEKESKKNSGRRGRWKVFLIIAPIGLVFGLVFILAGIVLREGFRARQAMMSVKDEAHAAAERLFLLGCNVPAVAPTSATLSRRRIGGTEAVSLSALSSWPLISGEAGLAEALKRKRDEINASFQTFLRGLAAFEQEKDRMTPEAAEKRFYEISLIFERKVMYVLGNAHGNGLAAPEAFAAGGALGRYPAVARAYVSWFDQTRIALHERRGNFSQAAFLSETDLGNQRLNWRGSKGYPDNKSFYMSDFYREHGDAEYHRVIYDYWRSGGMGYIKILDVALPRMYEDFTDRMRRAREP